MTREEQKQIIEFIESSVRTVASTPPVDFEADAIIRALFVRNPDAAYRITMLGLSQAKALEISRDQLKQANDYRHKGLLSWLFSNQKNHLRRSHQPGITSRPVSG